MQWCCWCFYWVAFAWLLRFILSLASCKNCIVLDDQLNILPISSHVANITPVPPQSQVSKQLQLFELGGIAPQYVHAPKPRKLSFRSDLCQIIVLQRGHRAFCRTDACSGWSEGNCLFLPPWGFSVTVWLVFFVGACLYWFSCTAA